MHASHPARPLRHLLAALLLLTGTATLPAALANPPATTQNRNPVITQTYLKAQPGERDRLARFLVANWFAMDAKAVDAGLFASYRLLENAADAGDWDLIVEVSYHDACGYACVAERFEAIRAAHTTVPIDGKTLAQLGRVLRTETLQQRDENADTATPR